MRALALVDKINDPGNIASDLREEIASLNTLDSLCYKHEIDWPIKGWRLNLFKIFGVILDGWLKRNPSRH